MDALEAEVERNCQSWRARIAELPGNHVAIEALWDGDTHGWFVNVALVTATPKRWWQPRAREPRFTTHHLGTLRYGGDIRLFNGQVPPWPEAIVAQRAGAKVASDLGLDFYFPSPDAPDDDCPDWWERDRATRCRTCGKPLVANRGPYVAADQCRPCALDERWRGELASDAPGTAGNRAIYLARAEGGDTPVERMFLNLSEPHPPGIDEQLAALLRARPPPLELSESVDTTLTPADVEAMRDWCARVLDERLRAYRPCDYPDHVTFAYCFSWRGVERKVQRQFNPEGAEIADLHRCHAFLEGCASADVRLFGNGGVTQRDASILAMVRARARTVGDLRAAFPFLSAEAIEQTLAKLERRGFLARDGEAVRLLLKGRIVDLAGP